MKLYPQDLRDRQHATIIRRRAYAARGPSTPEAEKAAEKALAADTPPHLGSMGKLWKRGTKLTEQEAATGFPAASVLTGNIQWSGTILALIPVIITAVAVWISPTPLGSKEFFEATFIWGIVTCLSMTLFPRAALLRLYRKPLSVSEIDLLLSDAHDDVDRAYLELLRDSVKVIVPDATALNLRDALRALGQATDNLPAFSILTQDTRALRLDTPGSGPDRSALVMQRAQALRSELLAQIEALHAGLLDFCTDGKNENGTLLATLSEDARRVADAAESVAQARIELDTYLAAPESAVVKAGHE